MFDGKFYLVPSHFSISAKLFAIIIYTEHIVLFLVLLGIHSGKSHSTVLLMVHKKTWVFYEKMLYILEKL